MAQNVYATQADLSVPQKALADFTSGELDDALAKCSSDADAYLRKRYNLPLRAGGWTRSLTKAVADLATMELMRKRGFNPDSKAAELMMAAETAALAWLGKVADNQIDPAFIDSTGAGQDETNSTSNTVAEKPFVVYSSRGNGWDPNGGNCGSSGGGFFR